MGSSEVSYLSPAEGQYRPVMRRLQPPSPLEGTCSRDAAEKATDQAEQLTPVPSITPPSCFGFPSLENVIQRPTAALRGLSCRMDMCRRGPRAAASAADARL